MLENIFLYFMVSVVIKSINVGYALWVIEVIWGGDLWTPVLSPRGIWLKEQSKYQENWYSMIPF